MVLIYLHTEFHTPGYNGRHLLPPPSQKLVKISGFCSFVFYIKTTLMKVAYFLKFQDQILGNGDVHQLQKFEQTPYN
jgi:hypothetical protein